MKLFGTIFITQKQQIMLEKCLKQHDALKDYLISNIKIPKDKSMSKKLTFNIKGEQDASLLDSVFKHDLGGEIMITTNFEKQEEKLIIEFLRFTKERAFHYLSIWAATIGAIYLAIYTIEINPFDLLLYVHLELLVFSIIPSISELFHQFNHFRKGRLNDNLP